jgi:hypothetical protein
LPDCQRNVRLYDVPTRLEEGADETIKAKRFDRGERKNSVLYIDNVKRGV